MFRNVLQIKVNHEIVQITNRKLCKPLRSYHKTGIDQIARNVRDNKKSSSSSSSSNNNDNNGLFNGCRVKSEIQSNRLLFASVHGLSEFPREIGGRGDFTWRCGRSNSFPVREFAMFLGGDRQIGSNQSRMYRKSKSVTEVEEDEEKKKKKLAESESEAGGPFSWLGKFLPKRDRSRTRRDQFSLIAEENSTVFDSNLPPAQVKQLKIAFAEGFILGMRHGYRIHGPSLLARVFTRLLSFFTIITIVITLFVILTGSFAKLPTNKYHEINPEKIHVSFDDVKGVDEAKQELEEVVSFLKNPEKFSALGGKLPKGVLLVGPPGTGKTLLARAVAGEAGVPFFHAAGPEFDEVLVGQGARRVRDLFKAAKENSPCVIFIDEIDSIGSKRTNSVLHPYANQTINQLLSEMDGFHQNEGIIVLGATNRRDDLDKALLRPGRFDVEVTVPIPDYTGRKQILELYLRKILCVGVDVDALARGTTGFTGADLENMVNQAALKAAIDGAEHVTMKYLENSRDKILMGPERKNRIPDEEANLITAYHEGGHAIVGYYTKDAMPLHKVTIMPRGHSLGHTSYMPDKERYHVTKSQLLASMDTMMGGRAAEELVFGKEKITSGASSDLKQATAIATHMVKDWGMSENIGLRNFEGGNPGEGTNNLIDDEIKRLLTDSFQRAKKILEEHVHEHKVLSEALLKYETLDADDIKAILMKKN